VARGRPYRFRRFARGLNTADGPYGLTDGYADDPTARGSEARDVLNVVSKHRGNVRKRPGSSTFNMLSSGDELLDLAAVDSDAAGLMLAATTTGSLLAIDDVAVRTTLASGLSTSARWAWQHLPVIAGQGPYYGMNGTDTPRYVTAALATAAWTATTGTVPNGTMMVYANNRLWVSGVASDTYGVFFSNVGDPRDWPVANITRFEPGDGQPVTGLGLAGPYVLVFKERAIYTIYDLDTSANRKLTDQAGTLSPKSIVATDRGTFFLDSERGVLVTDGNDVRSVSEQIQPTIDRISDADKAAVVGAWWQGHYYMACRLDGTTYTLLDYDAELDSWWVHSHEARTITVFDRGAGPELYAGLAAHGINFAPHLPILIRATVSRLMVDGLLTDDGANYRSYWSGPFHDFGSPHLQKRCRAIQLDGRGKADVYVLQDFFNGQGSLEDTAHFVGDQSTFGGDGNFGGAGTFGGGVTIGEDTLYSLGVGRVWSITVGNETSDDWELDSYVMLMESRQD
jgi:hypothetical protein